MTIIIIATILMFIINVIWIWHNLGNIEKPRKIIFIIVGLLIVYLITLLLYNISSGDVIYPSEDIQGTVKNSLLSVFTGLNSLIFLPFIANLFDKILEEEIEKDQAKKRIIIILIIFIVCIFIEKGYLRNTQEGIINIYNNEVQDAKE